MSIRTFLVSLILAIFISTVCSTAVNAAPKLRLRTQNLMVDALSRSQDVQYQDLQYKVNAEYKVSSAGLRSAQQLEALGFPKLRAKGDLQVITARLLERDGAEYRIDFAYDQRTHLLQSEHVYQVSTPRNWPKSFHRHPH